METTRASILIHRPLKCVFEYVDDPLQATEWLPNMIEVRNVVGEGPGQQFAWSYRMAGLIFDGESVVIDHVPSARRVVQTIGGIQSTQTFELEPVDGVTKLTLEVAYTVPLAFLGNVAERMIVAHNAAQVVTAVENIKRCCEELMESGVYDVPMGARAFTRSS